MKQKHNTAGIGITAFLSCLFVIIVAGVSGAADRPVITVSVTDGDTIKFLEYRKKKYTVKIVRLHGIDAPEKNSSVKCRRVRAASGRAVKRRCGFLSDL